MQGNKPSSALAQALQLANSGSVANSKKINPEIQEHKSINPKNFSDFNFDKFGQDNPFDGLDSNNYSNNANPEIDKNRRIHDGYKAIQDRITVYDEEARKEKAQIEDLINKLRIEAGKQLLNKRPELNKTLSSTPTVKTFEKTAKGHRGFLAKLQSWIKLLNFLDRSANDPNTWNNANSKKKGLGTHGKNRTKMYNSNNKIDVAKAIFGDINLDKTGNE